jgi:asparagine synthetase A
MQHATPFAFTCGTGVNDELDGTISKSAVQFKVPNRDIPRGIKVDESTSVDNPYEMQAEIVQSLAKWKRIMLDRLGCKPGDGIYCDSTSVRKGYKGDVVRD